MSVKRKSILFTFTGAILVLGYNNCGRIGFDVEKDSGVVLFSSTGKAACDADLIETYSKTYFPLLSTNCNTCHSQAQGSKDLSISYSVFSSKGANLINYKASNPHGGNNINLTNQIQSISTEWQTKQQEYIQCLSSAPIEEVEESDTFSLHLSSKSISEMSPNLLKLGHGGTRVTWKMNTDILTGQRQVLESDFSVVVRPLYVGNQLKGLEFSGPRIDTNSVLVQAFRFSGFQLKIENQVFPQVTTYLNAGRTIDSPLRYYLGEGATQAIALFDVSPESQVSFVFNEVELIDSPAAVPILRVSHQDLISNDPQKGIFQKYCLGCHSGLPGQPHPNLLIHDHAVNFAQAIIFRTKVVQTEDGKMPPAPAKRLSDSEIGIIQQWIDGGTQRE